jgi:multidrug resistance efflux pump
LAKSYETARAEAETANSDLASMEAALKAAKDSALKAHEQVDREERTFARDMAARGFAGVADLSNALRTQEEMDALEQRIRNHEASLGAARKRAETAQAAGQGIVAPDLESLRKAIGGGDEAEPGLP